MSDPAKLDFRGNSILYEISGDGSPFVCRMPGKALILVRFGNTADASEQSESCGERWPEIAKNGHVPQALVATRGKSAAVCSPASPASLYSPSSFTAQTSNLFSPERTFRAASSAVIMAWS